MTGDCKVQMFGGVKPKTRERKLSISVNWQGALKQEGVKKALMYCD
jgi:hypothetical protein